MYIHYKLEKKFNCNIKIYLISTVLYNRFIIKIYKYQESKLADENKLADESSEFQVKIIN